MNKKVCLVDGSGYIFRAFYAIPPLTTSDGIPVNAVLGFSNMFMRLTQTINCDYCLVLFDAKRANYRNDIFADYKGTRKEIPEELIPQFPIIREAADALNIHHLEMEGYEADDLIATYARKAREKGYDVVVVSADKDLMQLIRDGVELFDPMKDKFFTPEDVKEKFGVYPDKVIDVQALAGDSIYNVPGVAGIGIKTAAQLINEFGSLQEVLDRASEIKQQKRRQTLLDNRENALISLQLVTLKDDVPVENSIETYTCRCPEREKLTKFIDRYELNSIRTRANKWLDERCCAFGQQSEEDNSDIISTPKTITKNYELVTSEKQLKTWVEKICNKGLFAFDTETTGLNPQQDKIVGMSIAVNAGEACYIPLNHISVHKTDLFSDVSADIPQLTKEVVCKYLKPLFEAKSILKIGHNIKFDMHFMTQILGEESIIFPYDDTAVISYVLHSSAHGHGMDELAKIYLDYNTIRYEEVCGSGKDKITFDKVTLDKALNYAAEDADITLRLYDIFKPQLIKNKMLDVYESFDRPLIAVLRDMEKNGIMINAQSLSQLKNEFEHNIYHY
ncbi:MAG: DNA polymerase I, partial [Alphaproteobacteria bacterium]|nr:DNA polymerase I [Alphaproteobacteria bacterium]